MQRGSPPIASFFWSFCCTLLNFRRKYVKMHKIGQETVGFYEILLFNRRINLLFGFYNIDSFPAPS